MVQTKSTSELNNLEQALLWLHEHGLGELGQQYQLLGEDFADIQNREVFEKILVCHEAGRSTGLEQLLMESEKPEERRFLNELVDLEEASRIREGQLEGAIAHLLKKRAHRRTLDLKSEGVDEESFRKLASMFGKMKVPKRDAGDGPKPMEKTQIKKNSHKPSIKETSYEAEPKADHKPEEAAWDEMAPWDDDDSDMF